MPLYAYHCSECGDHFELLVRSVDLSDEQRCPSCGSKSIDRLPSRFASISAGSEPGGSCAPSFGSG